MIDLLTDALDFLTEQPLGTLVKLFWYTLSLEVPRYLCGFLTLGLAAAAAERRIGRHGHKSLTVQPTVSVVVVGHNEAESLERCLRSLREQSLPPMEVVVVSDGSSDGMAEVASRLMREGLVRHVFATGLRGSKSAGFNLALRACGGDIAINVDCDCSFDRFAIENMVAQFLDPTVGAACGDIAPRNGSASLIVRFQEIEYLLAISLGRRVASALNQVACVSGAFGGYRRTALEEAGGYDAGGGEDLDITLRLRKAGWKIAFARDAICYTDVPETLWVLVRQRLRWERDAIRLRLRKHRRDLLASNRAGKRLDLAHQWDFLVFELLTTLTFPFYLAWLFATYGAVALPILIAMQLGVLLLDLVSLALAAIVMRRAIPVRFILYAPGYSVWSGWVTRSVRLLAYVQEWFLFASRLDNYVPAKVRLIRKW